jgi:hypothetical protein
MVRPCVARGLRRSGRCGLASMYPALYGAFFVKEFFGRAMHLLSFVGFLCSI